MLGSHLVVHLGVHWAPKMVDCLAGWKEGVLVAPLAVTTESQWVELWAAMWANHWKPTWAVPKEYHWAVHLAGWLDDCWMHMWEDLLAAHLADGLVEQLDNQMVE